jgi:hypothetical protein
MRARRLTLAAACAALTLGSGVAAADTMNPELGARLAGMGERGIVNLQSHATKGRLCWTFEVHTAGITGASIRDAHGMVVARLGAHYAPKGCATVAKGTLRLIEAKPGAYRVWVDTTGHAGELRGKLFAGMAHM